MIQEIIAYVIIAVTVGAVVYSLFFKKDKCSGCGQSTCDGCPYCSRHTQPNPRGIYKADN